MEKSYNSLDLLEDCLNQIYNCRKANLAAKAKKNFQKLQRRQLRTARSVRPKTPLTADQEAFFDENEKENDLEEFQSSLSLSNYNRMPNDNDAVFGSDFQKDLKNKPSSVKLMQNSDGFSSVESKKSDLAAASAFDEFKSELSTWFTNNIIKRQDENARAELADFLTEKYMCQKLDPLPPSRTVSNIRKKVSDIIEDFTKPGKLTPEYLNEIFPETEALSKKENNLTILPEEKEVKNENNTTSKDSKDSEKKKMKDQYEAYMKIKKQASSFNQEAKVDDEKAKEYETHLDDIRSLITSIGNSNSLIDIQNTKGALTSNKS